MTRKHLPLAVLICTLLFPLRAWAETAPEPEWDGDDGGASEGDGDEPGPTLPDALEALTIDLNIDAESLSGTVTIEHYHRAFWLRQRHPQTQADGTTHRTHHINLVRPILTGI